MSNDVQNETPAEAKPAVNPKDRKAFKPTKSTCPKCKQRAVVSECLLGKVIQCNCSECGAGWTKPAK